MSVTGISYDRKQDRFILDYANDNLRSTYNPTTYSNNKMKNNTFKPKKRSKIIITVIVFLVSVISCSIAVYSYICTNSEWKQYCHSSECKRSAENLLSSMNFSTDPCEDFYQFACGNWYKYHEVQPYSYLTDWFVEVDNLVMQNISQFLSNNSTDDVPEVQEAKTFYKSCLNADIIDETSYEHLQKFFKETELPVLPPLNDQVQTNDISWIHTNILCNEKFDKHIFFAFGISADPKNRTNNKLHISKPTESLLEFTKLRIEKYSKLMLTNSELIDDTNNKNSTFEENIRPLTELIVNITRYLYESENQEWDENLENAYNRIAIDYYKFDLAISEITDNYNDDDLEIPREISISELQNITDRISFRHGSESIINWNKYFRLMDLVPADSSSSDVSILISNIKYLKQIFKLLSKTKNLTIKFYVWWNALQTFTAYRNSHITEIYNDYISNATNTEIYKRPRYMYCAAIVRNMFQDVVSYPIVNDSAVNYKIKKVSEMVDTIESAFEQTIKNIDWMDIKTKYATLNKVNTTKKYIGYPKYLTSNVRVYCNANNETEFCDELIHSGITETDFINNIIIIMERRFHYVLDRYRYKELNDFENETWSSSPMDVNAYNLVEGNIITIPAAIMQFPFYELGLESLNFGAIGSIIGHEMTHSVDYTGRKYDVCGNINPWWSNETAEEFERKSQCFVEYYNTYKSPDPDSAKPLPNNGLKTLDENIADNGGLRIAFLAYKNYVKLHGPEPLLRELDNYSAEQLFFLSYVNTYCENNVPSANNKKSSSDEHSDNDVRVMAVLQNSPEFADVWKCKKGTFMNPFKDRCRIW